MPHHALCQRAGLVETTYNFGSAMYIFLRTLLEAVADMIPLCQERFRVFFPPFLGPTHTRTQEVSLCVQSRLSEMPEAGRSKVSTAAS